ncbi:tRNA 2-thiouridine(34) synthase MnmA [[Mycoplasma] testudinis]|uniref:tRNA 2-thiouridine(34) synthase MnmA n=1 Tax=[Mycoplasma] testudinis TaxID=33924 RepID=UPI00055B0B48|nr:tRNA 2-thiouridine(34) synthase MnmA [[Mycoplasma] testudinis]
MKTKTKQPKTKKTQVIVGLSGGVDSAVSAYLLKKANYDVIGVFMENWDVTLNGDIKGHKQALVDGCSSIQDFKDAQAVAKKLKIKLLKINYVQKYWDLVFKKMIAEFKDGHTPNPDILCNQFIKFGVMLQYVRRYYPQAKFATGHYAKIIKKNNHLLMAIPADENKDQTYFLCNLNEEQLHQVIFPLENLHKDEVRKIAKKAKLAVANKKDSTGICFIGERNFKQFLENYFEKKPGKIILYPQKRVVGTHDGLMFYTIGQRRGLAINGMSEKVFVFRKNKTKNELYIAPDSLQEQYLSSTQATVGYFNWINPELNLPALQTKLLVRFRHRQALIECYITKITKNRIVLKYPSGSRAVTPGQYAVLYTQQKICLGGGRIINTKKH